MVYYNGSWYIKNYGLWFISYSLSNYSTIVYQWFIITIVNGLFNGTPLTIVYVITSIGHFHHIQIFHILVSGVDHPNDPLSGSQQGAARAWRWRKDDMKPLKRIALLMGYEVRFYP